MFQCTGIDHVALMTNDMEATVQFYCGILGMKLTRTLRTPRHARHYFELTDPGWRVASIVVGTGARRGRA